MIEALVGLGANLGEPERAFRTALERLAREPGLASLRVSGLYRTAPWGKTDQPPFLNAVAAFSAEGSPEDLWALLRREEVRAGRIRGERWGPRPLDLDLLAWGGEIVRRAGLAIPHPRLAERSFVLQPMIEVAPGWRHPRLGKTARELLAELEARGEATDCERLPGVFRPDGCATIEGEACLR